jgi:hypothetical protein
MSLFIAFAFLFIVPSKAILIIGNNSYFGTTNLVYGQPDQTTLNVTDSLIIHDIPV